MQNSFEGFFGPPFRIYMTEEKRQKIVQLMDFGLGILLFLIWLFVIYERFLGAH